MPVIDKIYAFVAEDSGPQDEGITGFNSSMGWMPMVAADRARVDSLIPIAKEIAAATGKKIKLLEFSVRSELMTI